MAASKAYCLVATKDDCSAEQREARLADLKAALTAYSLAVPKVGYLAELWDKKLDELTAAS